MMALPLNRRDLAQARKHFGVQSLTMRVKPADHVLGPSADDSEWKAQRRKGVGASEMASVLGIPGAHSSPYALWWQKRQGLEIEGTQAMDIGTRLEVVIADLFRDARPDLYVCRPAARLFADLDYPHMLCTPDYIVLAPVYDDTEASNLVGVHVRPLECKSDEGGKGWGKTGTSEVPKHHEVQALCQANIFGADVAYVARLAGKRFTVHPIDNDRPARDRWLEWAHTADDFLRSIKEDKPPTIDGHEATEAALKQRFAGVDPDEEAYIAPDLALTYDRQRRLLQRLTEEFRLTQNLIRARLGTAGVGVSDRGRFVQRRTYKNPGYTVAPYPVDGLWPIETKEVM